MSNIYLEELVKQKTILATNINNKNVAADASEKYNTLVDKVGEIFDLKGEVRVLNKENTYASSVTAAAINYPDTVPLESMDIGVKVKSKNMFDINTATKLNGMSVFTKADNTIQVSQTNDASWRSANIALSKSLIGKTVIVTAKAHTSGVNTAYMRIQWVTSSGVAFGNMLQSNVVTGTTDTLLTLTGVVPNQPDETHPNLVLMFYSNTNTALETGITYSSTYSDIQLEEGNSATPYTPYVPDLTATKVMKYGENVADIYGFSAKVIRSATAALALTNVYGTTISTINPADTLTVTQTKWNTDYDAGSFRNGYFCIGLGGLKEGVRYTFSCNIEVTDNHLSADTTIFPTTGVNEYVTNDFKQRANGRYAIAFTYKPGSTYRELEIRNKGCSLIISNMKLEVGYSNNIADTVYTPPIASIEYSPAADGTVTGIKNLTPITTLITEGGITMDITAGTYKEILPSEGKTGITEIWQEI